MRCNGSCEVGSYHGPNFYRRVLTEEDINERRERVLKLDFSWPHQRIVEVEGRAKKVSLL